MHRTLRAGGARVKSCAGLGRARQAVHVDLARAGVQQQAGQAVGGGAGGQHIVHQRQVLALHLRARGQGKGLEQVALALLGVASTVSNPRAGRSGNLMFTLSAFIVSFNMLIIGQRWVSAGQIHWLVLTLLLHGSVRALSALWLAKRHHNIHWRNWFRRPDTGSAVGEMA